PHPNGTVEGDSGWPGGGSWPGGIAGIPGAPYDLGNNYEMGSTGFTVYSFNKNVNRQINVFLHEIAHTYYNSSHRVMANTVHGRYFHAGYGWGMMNGYYTMPLANAWERWYSGWIEITHDIDETTTLPTSYNLKDYMQYGETMRLKLPHTDNQFIWLENHANTTNPFYKTTSSTIVDGDGDPFPIHPAGLYGVVNNLPASRSIYGWPNFSGANSNGSKVIYGKGNFDYVFDGIAPRSYLYGDDGLEVINKGENAYNGQNEAHWFRYDYGQIHDDDEENNIHYGYDPNGDRNEGDEIRGVDGKKVFGNAFFNAVLPERKLSAFTNPPLSNFQEINDVPTLPNVPLPSVDKNTLSPIILHSLSITPTINVNGSIDVMVNYFDGVIEDDFRMTGKVYLPNNEDIKLKEGKELLLNRSLSPNRIRADINGSFSDPTVFITADGGQLTLLDDSTLILDETSTMIYEEGSTLQMDSNTDLYIRNGALLCIKEGATVLLDPSARIYVQDGFLNVHPSIDISDNVLFAEDVPQNPQIVSTLQYCTVNSPEYIHSIDGTTVTNCISPVVSISPTEFVKLTSEEFVEINTIFEVQEGGFFEAEILFLADNCDEEFFFGDLVDPPTFGRNTSQNKNRESTIENPFNVFVMPNPSTGSFQVSVDRELQSLQYELFDFSGNLLVKDALQNSDPFTISNQNLAKGIYILRVISGGDSVSTKILIQ
ncbi:MAG: T9SS type A sorting domain-containing protein, partial [Bacteroidetes bacterium]|nr:T9SS type A sorting domain-containing protein [Bacteroidota bacterium]